jgi:hypothetical protein
VSKSRQSAKEETRAKQWLKLRAIYQQLLSAVIVGAENSDGSRNLEFVLRDENAPESLSGEVPFGGVRNMEDENCISLKMVDPSG